jgi:hypothetical protein
MFSTSYTTLVNHNSHPFSKHVTGPAAINTIAIIVIKNELIHRFLVVNEYRKVFNVTI